MDSYTPGLHILGTIYSNDVLLLKEYTLFKDWLDYELIQLDLKQLGNYYHRFPDAGYTGVCCLTESHISFHTWPEYGLLTLDVFLSNFNKNNDAVCIQLFDSCCTFFKATSRTKEIIRR